MLADERVQLAVFRDEAVRADDGVGVQKLSVRRRLDESSANGDAKVLRDGA